MMNKESFILDGRSYERINKTTAHKLYDMGRTIFLVPAYANPRSPWIHMCPIYDPDADPFEQVVNTYEYYNCNSQMGHYTKFYKQL